jgi:hypothetical protein
MKKKLAVALCLAALATPLRSEESLVGTAWQCGRDYLEITDIGFGGAAQEATIWPNKKGPYGDGEELMLNQLGQAESRREAGLPPNPYRWKNSILHYRGKPCAKRKPVTR